MKENKLKLPALILALSLGGCAEEGFYGPPVVDDTPEISSRYATDLQYCQWLALNHDYGADIVAEGGLQGLSGGLQGVISGALGGNAAQGGIVGAVSGMAAGLISGYQQTLRNQHDAVKTCMLFRQHHVLY